MPVIKVTGLPSLRVDQSEKLRKEILNAVVGITELGLKEDDVTCELSTGILGGLRGKITITITGLVVRPTAEMRDLLATFLTGAVNKRLPRAKVRCFLCKQEPPE